MNANEIIGIIEAKIQNYDEMIADAVRKNIEASEKNDKETMKTWNTVRAKFSSEKMVLESLLNEIQGENKN